MEEEMAKLDRVIRCVTSRRICFPLIFTIAVISLIVTSIQLSYVKPPRIYLQWSPHAPRHSRNLKDELVVNVQVPQRLDEKPTIVKDIKEYVVKDAFPKVQVPYLRHDFKTKIRDKPKPTLKKLQLPRQVQEALPEQRYPREALDTITDPQIWTRNYTKKSNNDVKNKRLDSSRKTEDLPKRDLVEHQNINPRSEKQTFGPPPTKEWPKRDRAEHQNINPRLEKQMFELPPTEELPKRDRVEHQNIHPRVEKQTFELPPEPAKGVVIITNYRSGSTFLGQLFNQHPHAFYTFEPLYPFGSNCTFQLAKRARTLQNMLNCQFPSMKELYNDIGVDPHSNHVHASCLRNNFCFRYNHEHLCTEDLCPFGNRDTCKDCGPVDISLVNKKCRSRKMSVIKVIKLCHVKTIEYLFRDPKFDLKVIHLVRDPRGIASSRLKIHPDWDIAESIVSACQRQAANVRAGRNAYWLKDRYKLVRYEDLASNPFDLAKEIYDFVGLPFVDSVKNWIMANTRSNTNATSGTKDEEDPYSTQRDSTSAMQAWRKHLSFNTVSEIQKRCFEALRSLGYKDFKTARDLHNLNLSAVL